MSILLSIARSSKILALVVIAAMAIWLVISCAILFSSVRADGMVTQLIEKHTRDDVYYCPVTVFRDSSGVEHTIPSSVGSNPPRFPVGTKVSVLYRTQNPDGGYLEDRFMLWIAPSLLIAISVFYGAVGYIISRLLQKKEL